MSVPVSCPECGAPNRILQALNDNVLAVARERRLPDVLKRLVDVARELVGARLAAVGVADDMGRFAHWVTSGLPADVAEIPSDPLLANVLVENEPYVCDDVRRDPRFWGWPPGYPDLASLLAVPIEAEGEVVGAFYLADEDTAGFSTADQRLIELVAPHAALAIRNARLHERSRELTVIQERTRLARELHDSVTQSLFSMRLSAETALAALDVDPAQTRAQLEQVRDLARTALGEMRALISELRPLDLDARGIVETLGGHVEVLRQVHAVDIRFAATPVACLDARKEGQLYRLAQEALANAVKHSGASKVDVELRGTEHGVRLLIRDDGRGFDPEAARGAGRYGLLSMRERAREAGARLTIDSAPGAGTVVTAELGA